MRDPTPRAPSPALNQPILNSITEGVFTVGPRMRIVSFNKAGEEITGISPEQVVGNKCHQASRAAIRGTTCPLCNSVATGEPGLEVDVEITGAEGKRRGFFGYFHHHPLAQDEALRHAGLDPQGPLHSVEVIPKWNKTFQ